MKTRKKKVRSLPSNIVRIYSVKWLYCFTYNYTGGTLVNHSIYDVNSFDHQLLHRHPTKVSILFIPELLFLPNAAANATPLHFVDTSFSRRASEKISLRTQCLRFLVNRFRLLAYIND